MSENQIFKNLKPGAHIHMMGICGTAMGSLAGILKELGFRVTGSDENVYPPMSTQLESLGIQIMQGYKKENLSARPDLVIVGNVIMKKYEEASYLLSTDIPYTSLPKAMGEIAIEDKHSIVLAGTHGKTTSTALMSWMAEVCGKKPGYMVGGIPLNFSKSFRAEATSDYFVIEGDEYDTAFFDKVPKFVHYKPKSVILTSIEFDHIDIYSSIESVLDAFTMLLERIPKDGNLIYSKKDDNISKILHYCGAKNKLSYGINDGDFSIKNLKWGHPYTEIDILYKGQFEVTLQTPLFGKYNMENVLASYALGLSLGWNKKDILESMKTFKGIKRRQEIFYDKNDVVMIDDFAHHPTAVKYTIEAVQEKFKNRRVISVFEPRSATSRRAVFQKQYEEAFQSAQYAILCDVFNKEVLEDNVLQVEKIVSQLGSRGSVAVDVDDIIMQLKKVVQPNDVILIMSNGAFGGIYKRLPAELF